MERETGIEPATNSLEGCDSTTELLPPALIARFARNFGGRARCIGQPASLATSPGKPAVSLSLRVSLLDVETTVTSHSLALACAPKLAVRSRERRVWRGK